MKRIAILPVPGTRIAENKDEAQAHRVNTLLPALEAGNNIELDFSAVEIATQSYVHALISEAIRRHGDTIFARVTFKGCSSEVREVVLTVFDYTVAASRTADAANPPAPGAGG